MLPNGVMLEMATWDEQQELLGPKADGLRWGVGAWTTELTNSRDQAPAMTPGRTLKKEAFLDAGLYLLP